MLVHGRDQDAGFMLEVAERARLTDVAVLLPESPERTWYPGRFFDPAEVNEPHLTRAVEAVEGALDEAAAAGIALPRILLAGFSQGACVVTEVVRRRPRPFGAVAVLTGALVGDPPPLPDGAVAGLRVHCSCSRRDDWIPLEHALRAARYFEAGGARVTMEVSDEAEHHVSDAEAAELRRLLGDVATR